MVPRRTTSLSRDRNGTRWDGDWPAALSRRQWLEAFVGPMAGAGRARETDIERDRRFINYPKGRVLAVADDEATAERALEALAAAGWDVDLVERLVGPDAADDIDSSGAEHGLVAQLRRLVQFALMDQLPDLAFYEAAARQGRIVLSIPAEDSSAGARLATILREAGAHFANRFGQFETEELLRWRGPEPPVRGVMKH
jgi:hypothetical protein